SSRSRAPSSTWSTSDMLSTRAAPMPATSLRDRGGRRGHRRCHFTATARPGKGCSMIRATLRKSRTASGNAARLCSLALALLFGATACGRQGVGERCDESNGDRDCSDGLACTPLTDLQAESGLGAVCCPRRGASGAGVVGACRAQELPELDAGPERLRDLSRY